MLRFLLGEKVDSVSIGDYGKPYIPGGEICFNLSHSGDYVVLASDSDRVGVDIEKVCKVPSGVAKNAIRVMSLSGLEGSREKVLFICFGRQKRVL